MNKGDYGTMNYEHELAKAIREFTSELRRFGRRDSHWKQEIMTALETLTDAVNQAATAQTELTEAVNEAIVRLGTPGATDAQLLTLATAVQANTKSDVSLTTALNAALDPEQPPVE